MTPMTKEPSVAQPTETKPDACPFLCKSVREVVSSGPIFWVTCNNCHAEGPTARTYDLAIAAWNRRAPSNPQWMEETYRTALRDVLNAPTASRAHYLADQALKAVDARCTSCRAALEGTGEVMRGECAACKRNREEENAF